MDEVTRILNAIEGGDTQRAEELLPMVYEELRLLAAQKLSRERPGHTLQATALVHEAYLRLLGGDGQDWHGKGHFFAAAAEAMRRILVENARRKRSVKHGGDLQRVVLNDVEPAAKTFCDDILALDEALTKLSEEDPLPSDLVKLRYFAGLTNEQSAQALGISPRTADRCWAYAKAWLYEELAQGDAR